MDNNLYLILGIIILLLNTYDFFFTTLSGNGFGFISKGVAVFADKIVKLLSKPIGRSTFKFNGLSVNLTLLFIWIMLSWVGLFFLYSSNPEAIVNSNGDTADVWERLYFTGYTLSTLGLGNFYPITPFFEIITSCFSFFGFILFTSSMSYFISVSSALVHKKTLVKSIYCLGKNPQEIADKLLSLDRSYSHQQILSLQVMVNNHTVNYHAYPVIHFFAQPLPEESLSLNLARLDEALSILIGTESGNKLREELGPLRTSILSFLKHLDKSFSRSMPKVDEPVNNSYFPYDHSVLKNEEQRRRRRILERLLKSEGFNWDDVL